MVGCGVVGGVGVGEGPLSLQINQLSRELLCCLYYESLPTPSPNPRTPPPGPQPSNLTSFNKQKKRKVPQLSLVCPCHSLQLRLREKLVSRQTGATLMVPLTLDNDT